MSSTVTTIPAATFEGANNVEIIFYTGTKEQAEAFQASAANNKYNLHIKNDFTLISATEYNALLDKSGKYIVYDYGVCDAFYNGKHSTSQLSPCVVECSNCNKKTVNHISDYETVVTEYKNGFMAKCQKTATCASAGYSFVAFDLKIVGFTDEYKDAPLALGAYAITADENGKSEISYMQYGKPSGDEKYCFISYNDLANS